MDPAGIVRWEGFPLLEGYELTESAVKEVLDALKKNPPTAPKKPVYPNRSGF